MGVDLALGIGQARMRQHQRPGAEQKVQHHARHLVQIGTHAHVKGDLVGLALPLLGKLHGLTHAAALRLLLPVLRIPEILQAAQGVAERLGVGDVERVQPIEGFGHRVEKSGEPGAGLAVVLEAALRHAFHQAAAGVAFLAEKPRIDHRQPQQRGLQRHDGLTHRHQQARVLRHLVDQLAHHLHAQHLADMGGVLFQLCAHQRAFTGAAVDAPDLRAELAQHANDAGGVFRRAVVIVDVGIARRQRGAARVAAGAVVVVAFIADAPRLRTRLQRRRRRVRRGLERDQLFFDGGVIRRRQPMVGRAATAKQEVLEQHVPDVAIGQVRVLRR